MKNTTFTAVVITIIAIFSVIEILFLPVAFATGFTIGMGFATAISIAYRKFVKGS